jgi:hypothetical protein
MDAAQALDAAQKIGIPVVLLAAGVIVIWRFSGQLLHALLASHQARVAGLEADRDHFRARSEAHEDRTDALCRELIEERRHAVDRAPPPPPPDGGLP